MVQEKNKQLKSLNTFGISCYADQYIEFTGADDLYHIFSRNLPEQWQVLSGGSNILFTGNYKGTLLHPTDNSIEIIEDTPHDVLIRTGAGTVWDDFVLYCVEHELSGAENLSYIPGYTGAAPVQNIGAYGSEAKDIIETVEIFDLSKLSTRNLTKEECAFGYRDSIFKNALKRKAIVTNVFFRLHKIFTPNLSYSNLEERVTALGNISLQNVRKAVIDTRKEKLPDPKKIGNGGSFFKNPVVAPEIAETLQRQYPDMPVYQTANGVKIPAGWLIDKAGWKGYRRGDAGVHTKQALVLVNYANASGQDILTLATDIQNDILQKFGIVITPEINIL